MKLRCSACVLMPEQSWTGTFPATVKGVIDAGRWIEALGLAEQFPDDPSFGLQLCLEEQLSNVVRHGNGMWQPTGEDRAPEKAAAAMKVSIMRAQDDLTVVVEDDGKPFDVVSSPVKSVGGPIDAVKAGGLGILLIKRFANGLSYERRGGVNRTTLRFS